MKEVLAKDIKIGDVVYDTIFENKTGLQCVEINKGTICFKMIDNPEPSYGLDGNGNVSFPIYSETPFYKE